MLTRSSHGLQLPPKLSHGCWRREGFSKERRRTSPRKLRRSLRRRPSVTRIHLRGGPTSFRCRSGQAMRTGGLAIALLLTQISRVSRCWQTYHPRRLLYGAYGNCLRRPTILALPRHVQHAFTLWMSDSGIITTLPPSRKLTSWWRRARILERATSLLCGRSTISPIMLLRCRSGSSLHSSARKRWRRVIPWWQLKEMEARRRWDLSCQIVVVCHMPWMD
mmetsp:Transcript_66856/g.178325  ORF Transcript_66856/g.178325 Transcript_66856/m.178325 type:complete len:220 (+) Transcript_66856:617-1276(+)